ncbi:four helix bundle protein [Candidatus Kuenenbacteria bacterium RIFCSPHIGHO2_12_FULL_42_14]|uniref:Four helix bundle protein n=2 Tax=Candidatus Kueneniibacteriota TaxID=1752740 RepID=A0A1F6GNS3_9BACT|nr:MAG: four helix bundle protein [Candidatus Kuenenbacteria bacterium RIFCSPHIGHO2_02_FULL_42_29]OGG95823.1 MAG: four helix bundle protein [Candidatus Kuenenbacteria bacterium RBG_16_41_7]OGG99680.1 MAG: four helix bundle protein [Candidatus Kuenenbacteria bacterium RIFCSPHIGHO2_12_FULL_42_14]
MPETKNTKYDPEERTTKFGENIINFSKTIPENLVTMKIIPQLVAAGTSIGANYCEADDAESGKDFKHKICICKKEARETKYWLRITVATIPDLAPEARILWQEANELNLIFNAIVRKINDKHRN